MFTLMFSWQGVYKQKNKFKGVGPERCVFVTKTIKHPSHPLKTLQQWMKQL